MKNKNEHFGIMITNLKTGIASVIHFDNSLMIAKKTASNMSFTLKDIAKVELLQNQNESLVNINYDNWENE